MSHSKNKVKADLAKAKLNAKRMERSGNTDTVHHDNVKRLEKALAGGSKKSRKLNDEVKEHGK